MSSMLNQQPLVKAAPSLSPLGLLLLALLALYVPSFVDLFHGAWASEKNAHGPIVMLVGFGFLYFRVRQLLSEGLLEQRPAPLAGGALLGLGLLSYALGRSQSLLLLEIGSLVLVLAGVVTAMFGVRTLRRLWFAFFFMLFMVPLPPSVVDVVTLPMKIGVSYATEHLLYWLGYPIARSGVILTIGPYQLLVADACAGLNSLFTLEALGLLYMNLVRHSSLLRNVTLAALIVPISFTANTIRIMVLALITYYMGDAAGQGFLHGFSGLVLFLSALLLIIGVDNLLNWVVRRRGHAGADGDGALRLPDVPAGRWRQAARLGWRPALGMAVPMLAAISVAYAMTPTVPAAPPGQELAASVPTAFAGWREMPSALAQADLSTADDGTRSLEQPYDDVLMRTYVNQQGQQIMMALAFAREQRQDVKLHLPEICYPAQGYNVLKLNRAGLQIEPGRAPIEGKHMLAMGNNRMEAVSYWVRIGDAYPQGGLSMRMKILRDGLAGKVSDGILVRASMVIRDESEAADAYALEQQFLSQLVAAANPRGHALVAGAP